MNFIVHWGLSMLVKVIFPSPACCGIPSAMQWSLPPSSCLLLLQESSLLLGDSCSHGISCVGGFWKKSWLTVHSGHYFCSGRRWNRCCCSVGLCQLSGWLFGVQNQQGLAFGLCATLGRASRISRASPSKRGLSSRRGHPMGGGCRNGRDLGIHRATAAGTTDSTWDSADSAKPVHLGLTRQKDVWLPVGFLTTQA